MFVETSAEIIKENMTNIIMQIIMKNKRIIGIMIAIALLLLLNLLAMVFTDAVKWSLFDFVVAGVLMIGAGLMFELVMRTVTRIEYRIAIFVALLAALLLIWVEIAVGLFG